MIAKDRDALVCDLAETYGILDMNKVPVPLLATLAAGLRDDSRIKTKMSVGDADTGVGVNTILLARISDLLALIFWSRTKDGQKGRNRPKSLVDILIKREEKESDKDKNLLAFDTPEDFAVAWNKMGGGAVGNGIS